MKQEREEYKTLTPICFTRAFSMKYTTDFVSIIKNISYTLLHESHIGCIKCVRVKG